MTTVGTMLIKFDGDGPEEVDKAYDNRGDLPMIDIGSRDYYLAPSSEVAGEAVRDRWRDMKDNDKAEFRAIIGDERLIQWACGESDSFGIDSFDEFLERVGDHPEEELASYDGSEREAEINLVLAEELGWDNTDDAELDEPDLRLSIQDGDVEIPAELRAIHTHLPTEDMTDEEAQAWAGILIGAEGSDSLDADGSITEILDTFRFVSCVAYRHN